MKRLRDWSRRLKRIALGQAIEKDLPPPVRASRSLRVEPLEDRRVMAVTVEAFTPLASGFTAQLSEEIRVENLNLFNSQSGNMGAADVTLQGASGGNIRGSLIVQGTNLTFIASGGILPADTYTATLRSSANGIVDAALGELLDGEFSGSFPSGNGTPGGDFVFSFTVSAAPQLVISVPDVARGPAQPINVPAVGSGVAPQVGLPIRFSQIAGITSLTLTMTYNQDLLDVTGVELGPDAPAGSQVEANFDVPGQVTIAFFSLEPLTGGSGSLIRLVANVPDGADYGSAHAIHFSSIEVNAGAIQAIGDSAVHVVAFPGDSNGNGRYDAEDARLIARVGVGLDTGFVVAPATGSETNPRLFALIDPVIIGDVTGVDGISPLDASDILRLVVGLPTPNIPALPSLAPTGLSLSATTIAEGLPVGTTVGTFTTIDPNIGDTHTYSLVAGAGDTDNASFTINGNSLRTGAVFNANVKSSYNIRVQTTDQTGRSFQRTFTITVTSTNQAPTSIALSNSSIAENATVGTTVGTLSTVDPNPADTHTYTLVTGTGATDNAAFTISGNNLVTATPLDFETKSSYSIRIRSTDAGGLFTEQVFTITVTGVNEAPTAIALSNTTLAENSPIGTAVGNFSTTDPDVGDTHTYALVTGAGSTDNGSFQIVGNTLQTVALLDAELQETFSIRVRSTDAGGLSTEQTFVITLTGVNESPTAIGLSNATIPENQPVGTVVGLLSTTDPDAGDTHTYTLVAGAGDTGNGSFTLAGNQLLAAAIFDAQTQSSYTIRVRSTDAGGLFTEQSFVITVTNVNDAPTAILLSDNSVIDAAPIGTVVGTLSTVDPDAGDTHTYTLVDGAGDTDNAVFIVVGNQLQTAAVIDFAIQATYSIRVRSTDAGGLSTETVFTIVEEGVNLAPTSIALSNSTIVEGEPAGTAVGTLSTTDPNAGDTHTYTLVIGAGDDDNASFAIDGTTVVTTAVFDFSTQSSYTIRVRSTDAGGLFTETAFSIVVTELNVAPTAISLDNASIAENSPVGTTVGMLVTTDANATDTHTYTLVDGAGDDDNAAFTISGNQVLTAVALDFETQSSYTIRVRSTDAGGLSFEQVFVITVTNVNEAPIGITIDSSTIEEGQPIGTVVGALATTDPDSGDTHTYTFVSGSGDDDNDSFSIVGNSLVAGEIFAFATKSSYTVRIRSTDAGGLFTETALVITVSETNVAPTAIALNPISIEENAAIGTPVGTLTTTDANATDTHTYTLVDGAGDDDNDAFTITGSQVLTAAVLDFETQSSYTIRVRSTDAGGLSFEQIFVITVTNVNEAPTAIALSSTTIEEGQPIGTIVGAFTTTDPDVGDVHTYTLVSGTGDDDNDSFTISGGNLVAAEVFDFTTKSSYTVRIRSTDADGLFAEAVFVINVTEINVAPTALQLNNLTIIEQQPIGTAVGTLSTTDANVGDTFTYTLVAGVGDDDNASFSISSDQVLSAAVFDFSAQSTYTIRVRTTDAGGLFTEQSFTITIISTNQAPTAIALDSTEILEDEPIGTVVGNLSTTDPDAGDTHVYSLVSGAGDDDNASFAISNGQLTTAEVFDFATKDSYTVRIRSEDPEGLFIEQVFVITITQVNVAPTAVTIDSSTIAENEPVGTVVGVLSSTDANASDSHTYAIVAGVGGDDNASFDINGNELVTTEVFDFETKSSYSVRIRTTDAGGLSFEQIVVITVTNVNEAPTAIALSNSTALDLSPIGTPIGLFSSTDQDVGDLHSYALVVGVGGDHNASFEIVGNELRTLVQLDFGTTPVYSIRVSTTDTLGLSFEQVFTITEAI